MREDNLPPREATEKSMSEIASALIGIALVLSAVFLPMAFFGGATGVIYRQFSITIVSAMALSVLVALTLTPALCATFLKPNHKPPSEHGFFGGFNRRYDRMQTRYESLVGHVIHRSLRYLLIYAVLIGVMCVVYSPANGLLPTEDQGDVMVQYTLPAGATSGRTMEVSKAVENYFMTQEKDNTKAVFTISGFGFSGSGQNAGMAFIALKHWRDRPGSENTATAIADRAMKALSSIRDAQIFSMTPPAVDGLGQSNGFTFELQATGDTSREQLLTLRDQLISKANKDPILASVRANTLQQMPQLQVDIDNDKVAALGLSISDVNATLSAAWGGTYINDFIDRGRVKKCICRVMWIPALNRRISTNGSCAVAVMP